MAAELLEFGCHMEACGGMFYTEPKVPCDCGWDDAASRAREMAKKER